MDDASLVLNAQHQHYARFFSVYVGISGIKAHSQELTFSVLHVECDPNVIVSCPVPLKCKISEVWSKCDQIFF